MEISIDPSKNAADSPGQTEGSLAFSESRLRALLEAAVDGIISIDERGIIQTINVAAERKDCSATPPTR